MLHAASPPALGRRVPNPDLPAEPPDHLRESCRHSPRNTLGTAASKAPAPPQAELERGLNWG